MRILVVEDDADLGRGLKAELGREGYAADHAAGIVAARALFETYDYDLVVLDITLGADSGLDLLTELRGANPGIPVLGLTARRRPEDRVVGLDAGLDDYLCKPFYLAEFSARVRALLRRGGPVRGPLLCFADLELDPASRRVTRAGEQVTLTAKEFALLAYLLSHRGKVISQEELLEHVWDAEANPFTNSVRVHINSLRRKLGDDVHAPRYIATVIGGGYSIAAASPASGEEVR